MPEVAWHPYADVAGMVENPVFNGTVNMTRLKMYRRSYYAAIAYTDYNIGVVISIIFVGVIIIVVIVVVVVNRGNSSKARERWQKQRYHCHSFW